VVGGAPPGPTDIPKPPPSPDARSTEDSVATPPSACPGASKAVLPLGDPSCAGGTAAAVRAEPEHAASSRPVEADAPAAVAPSYWHVLATA